MRPPSHRRDDRERGDRDRGDRIDRDRGDRDRGDRSDRGDRGDRSRGDRDRSGRSRDDYRGEPERDRWRASDHARERERDNDDRRFQPGHRDRPPPPAHAESQRASHERSHSQGEVRSSESEVAADEAGGSGDGGSTAPAPMAAASATDDAESDDLRRATTDAPGSPSTTRNVSKRDRWASDSDSDSDEAHNRARARHVGPTRDSRNGSDGKPPGSPPARSSADDGSAPAASSEREGKQSSRDDDSPARGAMRGSASTGAYAATSDGPKPNDAASDTDAGGSGKDSDQDDYEPDLADGLGRAAEDGDGTAANLVGVGTEAEVRDGIGGGGGNGTVPFELSREYNPLVHGCRSVENYERLNRIDEGTYGVVFRARCKLSGAIVALKQVKMSRDAAKEGFPITALRETNVLLSLNHVNIVSVREMVVGSQMDKVYMVMEFFDYDLKAVMTMIEHPFSQAEVKCLLLQLLRAIEYMHRRWYIHRDLKTSNRAFPSSLDPCRTRSQAHARSSIDPQIVVVRIVRSRAWSCGACEINSVILSSTCADPSLIRSAIQQSRQTCRVRLWTRAQVRRSDPSVYAARCDPLLSRAGAAARGSDLLDCDRHVERWLHLRRDSHQEAHVSGHGRD